MKRQLTSILSGVALFLGLSLGSQALAITRDGADLIVDSVETIPKYLEVGDAITAYTTIRNAGNEQLYGDVWLDFEFVASTGKVAAADSYIRFFDLDPGQAKSVELGISNPDIFGKYQLNVFANGIDDVDPNNNGKKIEIVIDDSNVERVYLTKETIGLLGSVWVNPIRHVDNPLGLAGYGSLNPGVVINQWSLVNELKPITHAIDTQFGEGWQIDNGKSFVRY